jgi:hypothetical protein
MGKMASVHIPEGGNGNCIKVNSKGAQITENKPKIILGEKDGVPTYKEKHILWEDKN